MPIVSSFNEVSTVVSSVYNFSVDKFPLSGPDGLKTAHYGLFRSDTSENVGNAVSGKYVPHTVEDISTLVEAARQAFDGELSVTAHWNQGHQLILQPTRNAAATVYGDDKIIPKLSIFGGFGGTGFKADLGFFRYTCSNLAFLSRVVGVSANIRHTLSMRDRIDNLVTRFATIRDSWQATQEQIAVMADRQLSITRFMAELFPKDLSATGRGLTVAEKRVETILGRLMLEREKLGMAQADTASGWMLWNAVQGYTQHNATRKIANVDLRGLATWDDPIVNRAEQLALTLAV